MFVLVAFVFSFTNGKEKVIKLNIDGMCCADCGDKIEKNIKGVKGVSAVDVDFKTAVAVITVSDDVKSDELISAVKKTDEKYSAKLFAEAVKSDSKKSDKEECDEEHASKDKKECKDEAKKNGKSEKIVAKRKSINYILTNKKVCYADLLFNHHRV